MNIVTISDSPFHAMYDRPCFLFQISIVFHISTQFPVSDPATNQYCLPYILQQLCDASDCDNFHEISLTTLVQSVQTAATLWIQMVLSPALKENNQNAMVA